MLHTQDVRQVVCLNLATKDGHWRYRIHSQRILSTHMAHKGLGFRVQGDTNGNSNTSSNGNSNSKSNSNNNNNHDISGRDPKYLNGLK